MATETASAADTPATQAPGGERTIPGIWRKATTEPRSSPAYLVQQDDGTWAPVSWADAGRRVDELAHGLLALGVRRGDVFSILSRTRLEWALVDFALAQVGAVVAPLYPTSSAADCAYILEHSEAVGVIAEDDAQKERIEALRGRAPKLEHLLTFDGLDDLAARGREHKAANPTAVEDATRLVGEDDLLMIVYTSGTTGPPKGCMMLHRNYVSVVESLAEIGDIDQPGDVSLLFLPLAHTYAQLVLYAGAANNFTVAFCPEIADVGPSIQAVRPTAIPSVPRVYEKIHGAVVAQFDAATGVRRKLIDWALRVGRRTSELRQAGRPLPAALAAQHGLADRLVYSKVKAKLGGNLRFGISGAAPMSVEILEFLHTLDILILEGYGLTESSSGCSVNRSDNFRFGTVGPPIPGVEVRIADGGEILIRGDNVFAGYYKDEHATRAALDEEGWLHTGDVGELEDGFLRITDRMKDILITAGGKNVAPQNIETRLKASKLVSQALVAGDRMPYLVALLTLDETELGAWAPSAGIVGSAAELAAHPRVREELEAVVADANEGLARYEQIKRFAILPHDFTLEAGELTPTMKVRRRTCVEKYESEIEALYA